MAILPFGSPPYKLGTGKVITSGTPGSILFVGASNDLQQDNANLFWDDSNNRLGVGGTPSSGSTFSLTSTPTINSGTAYGQYVTFSAKSSANSSASYRTIYTNASFGNNNNYTGELVGFDLQASNTRAITANSIFGARTLISQSTAAGTIQNAYGFYSDAQVSIAGGTISNNFGFYAKNPTISAGSLTTNYGLYIANQTAGSTNYSIYSTGGQNVLAGNTRIGSTANPTVTLDVAGNALFKNASDSTTAFQIQNAAGTSNLFIADTTNTRIGIGTASPTAKLHLPAGTTGVSTAPLKLISGPLMTAPEVGAIEFLTDAYYATITTGAARKTLAFLESPTFTGVVTIPTPFTIGAVSLTATGTELNYVVGVTSAIQTQLNAKAPLASPTFTGTLTAPTIVSTAVVRLKSYTVATLPAGTQGDTTFCTDLTTPTYMAVAVGGGAVVGKTFFDGTNWIT